jgi:hypothetical protein
MKFSTVVEQVLELLQRQRWISYRALKREFDLDDEYIEERLYNISHTLLVRFPLPVEP